MLGRISLNPIVHIDPIGTLLLPAIAALTNLPLIGWAKPVPVNLSQLRNGRRDFMLVAAAGPASNILLAILGAIVVRVLGVPSYGSSPFLLFVEANVMLAVFNMIPVPPLDGGNVLAGLLPRRAADLFDAMRPFGFVILYALMFTGMISTLIMPPARFLWSLLIQ